MATQITADLPTLDFPREVDYPTQEDWAAFSAAAELNFGILGGDWSTQMQLWKTQANAMSTELNTNATIAQGLSNYQGDWTSRGYTLNQTVSVGKVYYICKLTHSTGQNPSDVSSLYWNLAIGNLSLKVDTNMSGYTSKATPVDADLIPLSDSASSFGIKKLSWANLKTALATLFALKDSPVLIGTPTAPTQTAQDNSTKIATTAYVDGKMVLGTVVNSTSGTAIDFTGIPNWVKRITVMFNGVSTNGTSQLKLQIGNGSIISTGYASKVFTFGVAGPGVPAMLTSGFLLTYQVTDTALMTGEAILTRQIGDVWMLKAQNYQASLEFINFSTSSLSLSGTLDRIRITTVNGTDTFDSGQINILYER